MAAAEAVEIEKTTAERLFACGAMLLGAVTFACARAQPARNGPLYLLRCPLYLFLF